MNTKKLECPECGDPVEYFLFDASFLLEREFEDVYFVITLNPAGLPFVEGRKTDQEYLDGFNMNKWSREAEHMVRDYLEGIQEGTFIVCPKCKEPLE